MRILALLSFLTLATSAFGQTVYDIKEKDIEGKELALSSFKGKVLLIVNIASQCGFTGQLEDMQKLHAKYQDKGLVVLGVPSNEFGGQTPEDDQGMKEFCQKKYSVNFPLLSKGKVNGEGRRPLYRFLISQKSGDISWNFAKFLVGKDGKVIERWGSMTGPLSGDVTKAIERAL